MVSQTGESAVPSSRLQNRNIMAGRGRTSMRLEPELWASLREICAREDVTLGELVRTIEGGGLGGRTSHVRVFVLNYFRAAATEAGHLAAGHGAGGIPNMPGLRGQDGLSVPEMASA